MALLRAVIKVNPWSFALFARIPDAWKAVSKHLRPEFICYDKFARRRTGFLLNRFETGGKIDTKEEDKAVNETPDKQDTIQEDDGRERDAKDDTADQPNKDVTEEEDTADQPNKDGTEEEDRGEQSGPTDKADPLDGVAEKPNKAANSEDGVAFEALLAQALNKRQKEEDRMVDDWMKKMLRKHLRKELRRVVRKPRYPMEKPPVSPALQCPVCQENFALAEEGAGLMHLAGHLDDSPNRCLECKQGFPSRHFFVQHLRVHVLRPSHNKNQQCHVCGEVFTGSLKSHLLKHGIDRYQDKTCGVCGYKTRKNSVMTKHLRTHSGEKLYLCDLCPKAYTTGVYLKEHKLAIHEREAKFYCDMCTKSFYTQLRLRRHIKTHFGEKPYSCDQCGRGFTTSYNLRTHQRLHTGVKPYQCKLCDAAFVQKTSLDCHMKKHGIVMQRRPRSCDQGPDHQDQTDMPSRTNPAAQFIEHFKETWPAAGSRSSSTRAPKKATPSTAPTNTNTHTAHTIHTAAHTANHNTAHNTGPAFPPRAGDHIPQDDPGSSDPFPFHRGPLGLAASSSSDTQLREPGEVKRDSHTPREAHAWGGGGGGGGGRSFHSPRDEAEMWGGVGGGGGGSVHPHPHPHSHHHRGGGGGGSLQDLGPGPSWGNSTPTPAPPPLPGRASSFGEPPRDFPWLTLLTPRPHHLPDDSLQHPPSHDPGPQDFSFSAGQGYAD